jgi:hypothetical protein
MITFQEFLELAESSTPERGRRLLALRGPKKSRYSREAQQKETSDRAALRKAGFSRSPQRDSSPKNDETSSSDHHDTVITTFKNQTHYAKANVKKKVDSRGIRGKVTKTADRVRHLKALRKQMGGDRTPRQVHDVSIYSQDGEREKNDRDQLISRGKSFKKEIKAVPSAVKSVGGKPGDKVAGRPTEVLDVPRGTSMEKRKEMKKKGAEKRGKIYNKELGAKMNPKTGLNMVNLR